LDVADAVLAKEALVGAAAVAAAVNGEDAGDGGALVGVASITSTAKATQSWLRSLGRSWTAA
jgi:hypothetical protein